MKNKLKDIFTEDPHDLITDFEASVLDRAGHTVVSAAAAEREEVAAWFQDAQALFPELHVVRDAGPVPALSHEAQLVGRVGDDRVDAVVGEGGKDGGGVALDALVEHDLSYGRKMLHRQGEKQISGGHRFRS